MFDGACTAARVKLAGMKNAGFRIGPAMAHGEAA